MNSKYKFKHVIPFFILFALLSLLCRELYSASAETPSALIGESLPSFSLSTLSGNGTLSPDSLPKGQVSLINIWASWCAACRQEHPMMMQIKNDYHVPVYGILYKDSANDARQYLHDEGNPYVMVGDDSTGEVSIDFGVYGTPETYIVSPAGRIVYKHVGVISQQTWDQVMYPIIKKYNKQKRDQE